MLANVIGFEHRENAVIREYVEDVERLKPVASTLAAAIYAEDFSLRKSFATKHGAEAVEKAV